MTMFSTAFTQYGKIASSALNLVTRSMMPAAPHAHDTAPGAAPPDSAAPSTLDDVQDHPQAEAAVGRDDEPAVDLTEIISLAEAEVAACEKPEERKRRIAEALARPAQAAPADPAPAALPSRRQRKAPGRKPILLGSFVPPVDIRQDRIPRRAVLDVWLEKRNLIFRLRAGSEIAGEWTGRPFDRSGRVLLNEIIAHPHLTCSTDDRPGVRLLRVDLDVSMPSVASILISGAGTAALHPRWHEIDSGRTLKDMGIIPVKTRTGEIAFSLGSRRYRISRTGLQAI